MENVLIKYYQYKIGRKYYNSPWIYKEGKECIKESKNLNSASS